MTDDKAFRSPGNKLASLAERQVDRLLKASRWHKWQIRLLAGVIVGLMAVSSWVVYRQVTHPLTNELRSDLVNSCVSGNASRALDQQVWDSFISLLLKGNTSAQAAAEGKAFEQAVAKAYAPKNCTAAYSVQSAGGGNTSSLTFYDVTGNS